MDFSERLARAMSLAGYTQGRLAKEVGMAQSSVNKLLNGANGSRKTVEIASVLGVRPEWLSTGAGEMLADSIQITQMQTPVTPQNGIYRVDVLDVKASAGPRCTYHERFHRDDSCDRIHIGAGQIAIWKSASSSHKSNHRYR